MLNRAKRGLERSIRRKEEGPVVKAVDKVVGGTADWVAYEAHGAADGVTHVAHDVADEVASRGYEAASRLDRRAHRIADSVGRKSQALADRAERKSYRLSDSVRDRAQGIAGFASRHAIDGRDALGDLGVASIADRLPSRQAKRGRSLRTPVLIALAITAIAVIAKGLAPKFTEDGSFAQLQQQPRPTV